ncbi:MAG: DUF1064 domain-containing protein [Clostridia bacterium]|nr:DUF1064 domain-containing protein [Clostridia bacterium]
MSNQELKKLGIKAPTSESKYKSQKINHNGRTYDSIKEFHRHLELLMLQKAGEISELREQVPFELIPKQYDDNGKVCEHACKYIADFVYTQNGETVVEDTKGLKTEVYKIKRKLMLFRYGIRIKEI